MIKFIESSHRYIGENKREFISVSKLFDKFKEKQDWDAIAAKCALKETKAGNPTTKKEILAKWANKRDKASAVGTLYHTIREQELINESDPVFYNVVCDKQECYFDGEVKWSIPINDIKNNTVYPELMIYDEEFGICGQSDKVIITNNKINIWDYKTDAEITFKAFSNQWVKPRKLLPPLQKLDDANGNHYTVKMSLYMYMLWKANKGRFKPGDIIIEHVTLKRDPDNDNIPMLDNKGIPITIGKPKQIKLPYLKKEVEAILKTLKNG